MIGLRAHSFGRDVAGQLLPSKAPTAPFAQLVT